MDHALALFRRLPLTAEDRAAPAKPKPRPRGPVLMGDLHANLCGRPLFLLHWDEAEDDAAGS